jgi:uncharacterized protein (TIGR02001 family)
MKLSLLAAGVVGVLAFGGLAMPAAADGEEASSNPFSGTITLTSEYRFRGVSQSDNGAALQGSVEYAHDSGFYVNAWASTIDFGAFGDNDSRLEIDLTAGMNFNLSDQTEAGAKFVYYWYADADIATGDPEYNYYEIIANISHDFGRRHCRVKSHGPRIISRIRRRTAFTSGLTVPLWSSWFSTVASRHRGHQSSICALGGFWDLGVTTSAGSFILTCAIPTRPRKSIVAPTSATAMSYFRRWIWRGQPR